MFKLPFKILVAVVVLVMTALSQAQVTVIGQIPGNIQVRWGNGVTKPINNVESILTGQLDNDSIVDVCVRQLDGTVRVFYRDKGSWQCYPVISRGLSGYWPAQIILTKAHAGSPRLDVVIFGPVPYNGPNRFERPIMIRCNANERLITEAVIPGHGGTWFAGNSIVPDRTYYSITPVWNGSYHEFNCIYNGPAFHWRGWEPGISWQGIYRVNFAALSQNRWLN